MSDEFMIYCVICLIHHMSYLFSVLVVTNSIELCCAEIMMFMEAKVGSFGGHLNIMMSSCQHNDSHDKYKTVVRLFLMEIPIPG